MWVYMTCFPIVLRRWTDTFVVGGGVVGSYVAEMQRGDLQRRSIGWTRRTQPDRIGCRQLMPIDPTSNGVNLWITPFVESNHVHIQKKIRSSWVYRNAIDAIDRSGVLWSSWMMSMRTTPCPTLQCVVHAETNKAIHASMCVMSICHDRKQPQEPKTRSSFSLQINSYQGKVKVIPSLPRRPASSE